MIYNDILLHQTSTEIINIKGPIVTYKESEIIQVIVHVFLSGFVSLFGIIANVINVLVFCKQGLNSSINISFLAMAISDMCSLVMQQWLNVCANPLFKNADLPLVPAAFQYITAGVPREVFAKVTCLITVYVTAERCLCIVFPLQVKQIITPRRTAAAVVGIYSLCFLSISPLYWTTSLGWAFYSDRNQTLLGLVLGYDHQEIEEIVYVMQALWGLLSFVAVLLFTAILLYKLKEKRTWRQTANLDKDKSESMSSRDRKTMSMVVVIASILIVCYIPSVLLFVVNFIEPEFSIAGRYTNMFYAGWAFGFLFETINSSVNIFLYYKMSSKYRETFHSLFYLCQNTYRQ